MVWQGGLSMAKTEFEKLLEDSKELQGPMGAVAFAVLEMFRRGGLEPDYIQALHEQMKFYFVTPSNDECNVILKVVEKRLKDERQPNGAWY
jgi:hypothetical protein